MNCSFIMSVVSEETVKKMSLDTLYSYKDYRQPVFQMSFSQQACIWIYCCLTKSSHMIDVISHLFQVYLHKFKTEYWHNK